MHCPEWLEVSGPTGPERIDAGYEGEGLRFQVEEVHRCLDEGLTESPVMTLDETIGIARVLDDIRAQIGVVYPGESHEQTKRRVRQDLAGQDLVAELLADRRAESAAEDESAGS